MLRAQGHCVLRAACKYTRALNELRCRRCKDRHTHARTRAHAHAHTCKTQSRTHALSLPNAAMGLGGDRSSPVGDCRFQVKRMSQLRPRTGHPSQGGRMAARRSDVLWMNRILAHTTRTSATHARSCAQAHGWQLHAALGMSVRTFFVCDAGLRISSTLTRTNARVDCPNARTCLGRPRSGRQREHRR